MGNEKSKIKRGFDRRSVLAAVLIILVFSLCGCGVMEFIGKEPPPTNAEIMSGYYRVGIKLSNSADVFDEMYMPEYELLSQSKKVIACAGQKKNGYKTWYKMAGFDENEPTAMRKYLFLEDEKPKTLFAEPRANAIFECSMVLDKSLLNEPYSNDSTKLTAILKKVQENSVNDAAEVSPDNNLILAGGGMVNQALQAAIVKLENSPALAANLNTSDGVSFSHMSFDEGRIQMGIEYEIVTVKIKLGSIVKPSKIDFEKPTTESDIDVW